MMRRLQWRFIAAAMGAILIVLVVIIGSINLTIFLGNQSRLDGILDVLHQNDGRFPITEPVARYDRRFNDETAYESRYYIARFNRSGHLATLDVSHISAAHAKDSAKYAEQAHHLEIERGTVGRYRFLAKHLPDGEVIYLLDNQRTREITRSFLFNSVVIAFLCYIVTFILVFVFSRRAIRPFLENYRLQRRFITDAGHELKTPLAVISADVDIIELTEGKSEWTASIHRQVERMTLLISELLKLATMEERGPVDQNQKVDLSHLIDEAMISFNPIATHDNLTFELEAAPNVEVRGDAQSLTNLVSILLDNAIKYAPQDSTITITLSPRGKTGARLSVTNACDNPPDLIELNRVFERFYRTDKSRTRSSGGFGIGLSMAKAIVEAHHGRINATLEAENKVRFTVLL